MERFAPIDLLRSSKLLAAGVALSVSGWASLAAAQEYGFSGYDQVEQAPVEQAAMEMAPYEEDVQENYFTADEVRDIVRQEIAAERERVSNGQGSLFEASTLAEGDKTDAAQDGAADDKKKADEAPKPIVVGADSNFKASWKNGIEWESTNKEFRVHLGGRTQIDGTWYQADNNVQFAPGGLGELQDAVNFRRARLRVDGAMYEVVEYAAEYDFVNEVNDDPLLPVNNVSAIAIPAPTDLWFTLTHLPAVGNLRVGNYKEPIGLEHLTSSRFLDFMERSFLQDAFFGPFNNGFSPGIGCFNTYDDERGTWNIGAFKNTNNIFASGVGDGEYAVTGRLTYLPIYKNEGRQLFHLGLAGSHRDLDDGAIRIRSRASLRSGSPGPFNPVLANTGVILGDSQDLLAAEALAILGPLQFQAEYVASFVNNAFQGAPRGDVYFNGYYAECLYFLTGEHRPYNKKSGAPDRIIPFSNYFFVNSPCGPIWSLGAWQVGVRYSQLDLRDSGIDGGIIQDVTFGLNWFLNPNMKVQWNYVATHRDAPNGGPADGNIHGFGMRVAHDF